jgi:plasmid stability protein
MCLLRTDMRLVRIDVADEEYRLLRLRAASEGKTMKEVAREALHAFLNPEEVDPEDPIFRAFPLARKSGRMSRDPREHDELLFPSHR